MCVHSISRITFFCSFFLLLYFKAAQSHFAPRVPCFVLFRAVVLFRRSTKRFTLNANCLRINNLYSVFDYINAATVSSHRKVWINVIFANSLLLNGTSWQRRPYRYIHWFSTYIYLRVHSNKILLYERIRLRHNILGHIFVFFIHLVGLGLISINTNRQS